MQTELRIQMVSIGWAFVTDDLQLELSLSTHSVEPQTDSPTPSPSPTEDAHDPDCVTCILRNQAREHVGDDNLVLIVSIVGGVLLGLAVLAYQRRARFCKRRNGHKMNVVNLANTSPLSNARSLSQTELPPGWKAKTDPSSGRVYYFNALGESSWERP